MIKKTKHNHLLFKPVPSLLGILTVLGVIFLFIVLAVYRYFAFYSTRNEAYVQTVPYIPPATTTPNLTPTLTPNLTPTPTPYPHTIYTSTKLGISFSLLDYADLYVNASGTGKQFFYAKEIGDKFYIYSYSEQPFPGTDMEFLQKIAPESKYVEVFDKDTKQSLTEAIKQRFLTGYSESDCFVKTLKQPPEPMEYPYFEAAQITIPHDPTWTYDQWFAASNKCPKDYTDTGNGVAYFLMDTQHPNKLLFFLTGQDDIPSGVKGYVWNGTIKVLQ